MYVLGLMCNDIDWILDGVSVEAAWLIGNIWTGITAVSPTLTEGICALRI